MLGDVRAWVTPKHGSRLGHAREVDSGAEQGDRETDAEASASSRNRRARASMPIRRSAVAMSELRSASESPIIAAAWRRT